MVVICGIYVYLRVGCNVRSPDSVTLNTMKKTNNFKQLLFVGLLCMSLNMSAQTAPFRFGVKAGLNLSSAIVDAADTDLKTGYHIGGTVEYLLPKNFLIQSGLLFSVKGSKINNLNENDYIGGRPDFTHTFNELYLELPLYGAYKMDFSNNFNIVFGLGPYFGYGIGGKTKQKLNSGVWSGGITEREWDTFGDGVFDESLGHLHGVILKRLDIGIGVSCDLEYRKFILGIGYECSLKNIAINEAVYYREFEYKNSNIQISVGYKF